MSLANPNDIIIPNTTGIISQVANEAKDSSKVSPVEYVKNVQKIHDILQERINGEKLEELVDPKRISNSSVREKLEKENYENKEIENYNGHSAYDALGRE